MSLFTGIFGYLQGRVAEYEQPIDLLARAKGREGIWNKLLSALLMILISYESKNGRKGYCEVQCV